MTLDTDPPPTSAPTQGRIRRENVERILKAAELVFAEAGCAGATMADIADRAGLPKANLHYYFGTKEDLYRAVLDNILRLWLTPIQALTPEADPATALTAYVTAKLELSRTRPHASKVFANEILHGATQIEGFLAGDLRRLVDAKAAVIDGWVAAGRIAPLDARQFLFMIWAVTQHYADFDVQIRKLLGRRALTRQDFAHITAGVLQLVLRAAGLPDVETPELNPSPPNA
ncbi:TetR/AcrR family transcriptional regulator [Azospirillum agricola]|uniref:TetR/AcrR family transcriptional regulator n=1 Tax=Azospirillum agricola TaxID=1720247 RepID=UPI001AE561DD|nr:TetR/AcrR family transcriptional regulator [Azospirillum agricola]MBP2230882.1 TetR/AcrR family transcriptional regulator [Azospirillum agricola]